MPPVSIRGRPGRRPARPAPRPRSRHRRRTASPRCGRPARPAAAGRLVLGARGQAEQPLFGRLAQVGDRVGDDERVPDAAARERGDRASQLDQSPVLGQQRLVPGVSSFPGDRPPPVLAPRRPPARSRRRRTASARPASSSASRSRPGGGRGRGRQWRSAACRGSTAASRSGARRAKGRRRGTAIMAATASLAGALAA